VALVRSFMVCAGDNTSDSGLPQEGGVQVGAAVAGRVLFTPHAAGTADDPVLQKEHGNEALGA
jgi:hypothetical protein